MQYTEIFSEEKNENFIGKKKKDFFLYCRSKHTRWVHVRTASVRRFVLTSTHNVYFGSKIRKLGIPLQTPIFLYKSGVSGHMHSTDMFS